MVPSLPIFVLFIAFLRWMAFICFSCLIDLIRMTIPCYIEVRADILLGSWLQSSFCSHYRWWLLPWCFLVADVSWFQELPYIPSYSVSLLVKGCNLLSALTGSVEENLWTLSFLWYCFQKIFYQHKPYFLMVYNVVYILLDLGYKSFWRIFHSYSSILNGSISLVLV